MFPLDLLARFASLLDNEVRRVALDNNFDFRLLVARYDDEMRDVCRDPVVFSRRQLNRLEALVRRALAMERKHLLDAMLLCAFLDALVDRTKDFLVACRRVRKVHEHILPRFRPICQSR